MNDNIINLFGENLALVLNKPPIACKGLIRFFIQQYLKKQNLPLDKKISFSEFMDIIEHDVRDQLLESHIISSYEILDEFLYNIRVKKALFSMNV